MFATIINKCKEGIENDVGRIFSAVFECTLQMITRNFEVRAHAAVADGATSVVPLTATSLALAHEPPEARCRSFHDLPDVTLANA